MLQNTYRFLSLLIIVSIAISCRPYKTTTAPNIMTYDAFRNLQQSFQTNEGTIKYIDQGEGEVLLLLHGVPSSGWLYRKMIPELSKSYRVIVPDMLGFGSSDSPDGYEIYSEEKHAERLLALMKNLGITSWTHVMHDAGGLWTYAEGFDPPVRFRKGAIAKMVMWSYRNGITTNMMLKGLFKSGLTENNLSKEDVEGYKRPLREGKTNAMYYFFTQTCHDLPDYHNVLKEFNKPATVIWGANDSFLLWEPQKETVIRDLEIDPDAVHIIQAKHFIQEEQPGKINALILEYLKK